MKKTYMIKDAEIVAVVQAIIANASEFKIAEAELRDRFQKEADGVAEKFNQQKDDLWADLHEKLGLPTFNKDTSDPMTIDDEYLAEHGVAFIIQESRDEDECDCPGCRARRESGDDSPMSLAEILGLN